MLRIKVIKGNIEKAIKDYKEKFRKIKLKESLINRKEFTKPSKKKREKINKAIYINKKNEEE